MKKASQKGASKAFLRALSDKRSTKKSTRKGSKPSRPTRKIGKPEDLRGGDKPCERCGLKIVHRHSTCEIDGHMYGGKRPCERCGFDPGPESGMTRIEDDIAKWFRQGELAALGGEPFTSRPYAAPNYTAEMWWSKGFSYGTRIVNTRATQRFIDEATGKIAVLETRRDELLQLVAKISQATPLESEVQGALTAQAALIAEVGTLKARIRELECSTVIGGHTCGQMCAACADQIDAERAAEEKNLNEQP